MSSIYGTAISSFSPNILGTQELSSSIQSAVSNVIGNATSKTNENLILETKTANDVIVKSNNTTVATFSAINTDQPRLVVSGVGPKVLVNGNSSSASFNIPGITVTNESRDVFIQVPGSSIPTNPCIGSSTSDLDIKSGYATATLKTDGSLKLQGTNSITLSPSLISQNYILNFPSTLPSYGGILYSSPTGQLSFEPGFVVRYSSNVTSSSTTVQSVGPPQVWPEVVKIVEIPANAMGMNGMMRIAMAVRRTNTNNNIYFGLAASTNNTPSIVGDARLMGTIGSIPYGQSITGTNLSYLVDNFYLYLDNSTTAIKYRNSPLAGLSNIAYLTSSVDTSQPWYIKVFLSTDNAATAAVLESLMIETLYA